MRLRTSIVVCLILAACTCGAIAVFCDSGNDADGGVWRRLDAKIEKAFQSMSAEASPASASPGQDEWQLSWKERPAKLLAVSTRLYAALPQQARDAVLAGEDVYLDTDSAEKEWRIEGKMRDELCKAAELPFSGRPGTPMGISVLFHRESGRDVNDPNKDRLAIEADVLVRLSDGGDARDIVTLAEEKVPAQTSSEKDPKRILTEMRAIYERKGQLTIDDIAPMGLLSESQIMELSDVLRKQSPSRWMWLSAGTPVLRLYALLSTQQRNVLFDKGLKFSDMGPDQQSALLSVLNEIGRHSVSVSSPKGYFSNPKAPTVGIYKSGRRLDKTQEAPRPESIRMQRARVGDTFTRKMDRDGYPGMFQWIEGSDIKTAWKNARKQDPTVKKSELLRERSIAYSAVIKLADGKTVSDRFFIDTVTSYADIERIEKSAKTKRE